MHHEKICCRGDREQDSCADVGDEGAEQTKHFDEEIGSGSHNQGTMAGTSKMGDHGKRDTASASITEREVFDNKNIGKVTEWKKS